MNKMRYPEKKYLAEYDLSSDFFNKLGIKVNDIIPLRKVFILQTPEGKVILKKIDYDEKKLNFISACIESIYKTFPYVISFRTFKDGKKFVRWNGDIYILMDLIPGREVVFSNPVEFKMSGELLAKMHLTSKDKIDDIVNTLELVKKDAIDKSIVIKFQENLSDLISIREWIRKIKYKDEFDEIVINIIDNYIEEMERATELLSFSSYSSYREKGDNIVVCHNDLAEHNFLISNEEMYLIDFDYCTIDLRIVDIADLILKGIKNAAFDVEKALNVIEAYNSIYPLEIEEYKYIYILLLFPRDIYSIIKSYYHKEKNWEYEVYISRLKNKLSNEEFRHDFLNEYKKNYMEKFS